MCAHDARVLAAEKYAQGTSSTANGTSSKLPQACAYITIHIAGAAVGNQCRSSSTVILLYIRAQVEGPRGTTDTRLYNAATRQNTDEKQTREEAGRQRKVL